MFDTHREVHIMKWIALAVTSTLLATPALAAHCPMDAAAVEAGLAKMEVSEELETEVTALKDEGMALHEAGSHDEAEAKLAEAMRKLLTAE
ncbi:hypothetical protein VQ042_02660 [Aurantimonas sp. A2-1-M11]|uniref:hypothetical protein n=1 Tax=Aurantimonas sp. A2-1-M11 TaxID=3113712 RepID=UPI002F92943B